MDLPLVLDVVDDTAGPVHEVTEFVAGAGAVHLVLELLLDFLAENILCGRTVGLVGLLVHYIKAKHLRVRYLLLNKR